MTDRATHLRRIERERREALVLLERGAEGFEFRPLTAEEKKEFENPLAAKGKLKPQLYPRSPTTAS